MALRMQSNSMNAPRSLLFALSACLAVTDPARAEPKDLIALQEIVVTAQRRAQSVQDVPISISAYSAEMLEDLNAIRSDRLFTLVPGVSTLSYGMLGSSSVSIRGVGSLLVNQGVEQNVSIYVDDVVIGTSQAYDTSLFDVERVEVLRGPQGTLYGKNSVGGAFKFITRQPDDVPSLSVDGAYGNHHLYQGRGVMNIPVNDKVAWRLALSMQGRDPVVPNTTPGAPDLQDEDSRGARLQTRILASENTTVGLAFDWTRDHQTGLATGPFDSALDRETSVNQENAEDREILGAAITVNHEMGAWGLTSITAWREMDYTLFGDGDSTALSLAESGQSTKFSQVSQEVRLTSPVDSALSWVFGAFYYRDSTDATNDVTFLDAGPAFFLPYGYGERSLADIETQTAALFADATWKITQRFALSAGLRYTHDAKDISYEHTSNYPEFGGVLAPVSAQTASRNDDMYSPRLVGTLDWTDDVMTYASVTRGTKGGGFNALFVPAGDTLPIGPETAWNYEVGLKSRMRDGAFGFNASLFHFDWRNQQVNVLIPGSFGLTTRRNAGQSRSSGGELDIVMRPVSWGSVSLGYAYNDAHFVSYRDAPTGDLSGNDMPNTSRHHVVAQVQANRSLGNDLALVFATSYIYKSEQFLDTENTLRQPGFDLVNTRLGIESARWGASLFVENLFDEAYRTSAFIDFLGQPSATINNPRTYGLRLYYRGDAR